MPDARQRGQTLPESEELAHSQERKPTMNIGNPRSMIEAQSHRTGSDCRGIYRAKSSTQDPSSHHRTKIPTTEKQDA